MVKTSPAAKEWFASDTSETLASDITLQALDHGGGPQDLPEGSKPASREHSVAAKTSSGLGTGFVLSATPGYTVTDADDGARKINEDASSWHHAMRIFVLGIAPDTPFNRVNWFMSSALLILVQMLVLLSFVSSLSFKRCVDQSQCLNGRFCAGRHLFDADRDPYATSDVIHRVNRGTCFDCSSSLLGREVPGLLDELCAPNITSSATSYGAHGFHPTDDNADCLAACSSGCVPTLPAHTFDFSNAQRSCAGACAATCAAKLATPKAVLLFASAQDEADTGYDAANFNLYLTWRSVREQCQQCQPSVLAGRSYRTTGEVEYINVISMSFFDHVSMLLAAAIVALTVTREIRDMMIGDMMMRTSSKGKDILAKAGLRNLLDKSTSRAEKFKVLQIFVLRYSIGFLIGCRRYLLVPNVLTTVVLLVTRLGGDTVSVMLNTMATLFMLELDNLAFDYGLTVSSKEKIQENWEVVLEGFQTRLLNSQRRWHVSSMTLGIPLIIIMSAKFVESSIDRQLLTFGLMIGIVAIGELIELAYLYKKRTFVQNAQRIGCFLLKVPAFLIFQNATLVPIMLGVPKIPAPWDPRD